MIPQTWEDVTPGWLTGVLAPRFPDARVGTVELLWTSDGTNRRARFGLTYESGAGPEVVFVKAEGKFRESHAKNGNMFNEPLLFASGVPLPVDRPDSYASLIDMPSLDWLIVMEDIAQRGGDARDATRPMSPAQVTDGVRGLARLHRQYWNFRPETFVGLDWVQTWAGTEGFLAGIGRRMALGIERMDGTLPTELDGFGAEQLVALCGRYMNLLGREPHTLLHGDAHIGNTYVLPDDSVGFLDWQVTRCGHWSGDIGYFVMGAMTTDDRREYEHDILAAYRGELGHDITGGRGVALVPRGIAVWPSRVAGDIRCRRRSDKRGCA